MAKDKQLWYGFLEAGPKSTAVLIDRALSTGNPDTLYLFNLARGKILEYSRVLVESKLRELDKGDTSLIDQLEMGFASARENFQPRPCTSAVTAEAPKAVATERLSADAPPEEEIDADEEELDELIGAGGEAIMDDEEDDWDEDED